MVTAVFISEIHYDNDGADTGEFIEVTGDAGTDLSGYSLVLYNGNGGVSYNTVALSGILSDDGNGQGALAFDIAGIQNGSPDGVALVDSEGAVVEFLSYEGAFTAVGGPADGLLSTDINVTESSSTQIGESLQLLNGVWTSPAPATKGVVNEVGGGGNPDFKFIHEIQGGGPASSIEGELVTVEAIVVGDFQGDSGLSGFFLQEENADADADAATSEGVFIFDGGSPTVDVQVGDQVRVTGTVAEFNDLTELTSVSAVEVISSGNTLPIAATVSFPITGETDLEAVEGMLVTIPDRLFVTEYFNLDRFGQISLASDGPGNAPCTDGR